MPDGQRRIKIGRSCNRLKRDIEAGKIDVVIFFKLDRITRSLKDFVDLWDLFAQHDVDVISLREKFDTSMPTGVAMVQLIMVFAQLERSMTAERTVSIMRDRAERGLWNGGHVLGYRVTNNESGKLEIDHEEAKLVHQIFDGFEELGSAGAITRRLSEAGIRYPTYKTRSDKIRGGNLFSKQKIIGLLRNAIYIGRVSWGEVAVDDCHEPIISKEQFERVQQAIGQTTKRRTNRKKQANHSALPLVWPVTLPLRIQPGWTLCTQQASSISLLQLHSSKSRGGEVFLQLATNSG